MLGHDPNDTKPCPHMRRLVSEWADGALGGIALWYTRWHVSQCPQCQKGLKTIQALRDRLKILDAETEPLTPDRRAAAETEWENSDREKAATGS